MRFKKSKNASQNRKNRKYRNFQKKILYHSLPQTNHFRYRNGRSHRPVLETEERIQKLVDSEENDAVLLEARKSQATEREQN